jgi:hypothetical protein
MQTIRKTQRKGSRSTQNIKRFKQTEQKMTLFEMFERFMAFKQTEGLANPTIQGYYENGGDPFSLQKILGHCYMSMVRKYIQMTDSDVKRQHNSFSPLKSIFGR